MRRPRRARSSSHPGAGRTRISTSCPTAGPAATCRFPLRRGGSSSPGRSPLAAARFLARLRKRRYAAALIAQPRLGDNFMRGALVSFPHLAGAREVLALEPGQPEEAVLVRRGEALTDLVRWLGWRVLALPLAAIAIVCVSVARRFGAGRADPLPHAGGTVVYLRTDLELAGQTLEQGGSAAHTLGIVAALLRRGFDVAYWGTGAIAGLPGEVAETRMPVKAGANLPRELAEFLSGLRQSRRRAGPPGVALVYQRYSLDNLAGAILARRWRVPLVLEANASEVEWRRAAGTLAYPRLARACERLLLDRSARVVTVSENAARELRDAGADGARLAVVPNAVEVDRFAGARPRELPFPDDAFVVGFAGSFYPWHGVRVLAEAFADLHDSRPGARLLLVGDGEDRPHVEAILAERGKADHALLTGPVPATEVPAYLAASDVLASPHAADDGFIGSPVKLFEYMAGERAIVASKLAQLGQLLRDGQTALLVAPGDPRELCDALLRLHDDPGLREQLGRAACQEAGRLHTWDARLDTILERDA